MQIKQRKISELIPYANNARMHSEEQVQQIAESIKTFGFNNPVLLDGESGVIAGHGRLMGAEALGLDTVPSIELGHLSEDEKRAYIIADNKLAENAYWDNQVLGVEFAELMDTEIDLELTGFGENEIADMINAVGDGGGLTDPDEIPPAPDEPVTVLGDVWTLGRHRLMCGDSTSIDAVEKLMNGQKADMVFTDPPYGVSFVGLKGSMYSAGKKKGVDSVKMIKSDNLRGDELSELFETSILSAALSSKDGAAFYIFFGINRSAEVLSGLSGVGLEIRNWLIWDKGNVGFHAMGAQYKPNYEAFLYCHKSKSSPAWYGAANEQTIWRHPVERHGLHPTMKPVSLVCHSLKNSSKNGDVILDLFAGSGSAMIACESAGRSGYMMELDPKYCDVIITRWQDFTGKEAVHENGNTFNQLSAERTKAA